MIRSECRYRLITVTKAGHTHRCPIASPEVAERVMQQFLNWLQPVTNTGTGDIAGCLPIERPIMKYFEEIGLFLCLNDVAMMYCSQRDDDEVGYRYDESNEEK